MLSQLEDIKHKLSEYKKKYFVKKIVNGTILLMSILLITFLCLVLLEYVGNFNSSVRKILFFSFIGVLSFAFYKHLWIPIKNFMYLDNSMSDQEASLQIGEHFPDIKDKLLNTLQLQNLNYSENSLVLASIQQKTQILEPFSFKNAIDFEESKKFILFYLTLPLLLFFGLLIFNSKTITTSSKRLIHFNEEFIPQAPFNFKLVNSELSVFSGENIDIQLVIDGKSIPEDVYIVSQNGRVLMQSESNSTYKHSYFNIQNNLDFWFEGAGYNSQVYNINVLSRPFLEKLSLKLEYPSYLNKKTEESDNLGNLSVPEGTKITWKMQTKETNSIEFVFGDTNKYMSDRQSSESFEFKKTINKNTNYLINLKNKFGNNKDKIQYAVECIPDKFPNIQLEQYSDTLLYSYILIGGGISDDYGLSQLKLYYRIVKEDETNKKLEYRVRPLPFNKSLSSQNFVYQFQLDTIKLSPGDKIEYFVSVWDNDGVNGNKSTRSGAKTFQIPSETELKEKQDETSESNKNQMSSSINKANEIQKELQKLSDELKTKRDLTWQDKKDIEKLLQKQRQLQAELEALNQQMEMSKEQKARFEQSNPELEEKIAKLQELMQQLMDPETQKLMEELQKLMENPKNMDEVNKKLEELAKKENNFEKELDRALEVYKQLELEEKMQNSIDKLESLSEKEKDLQDKTDKAKSKEELQNIQEEQEKLNKEFEEVQKELDKIEELNNELENKHELGDLQQEEQNAEENLENSSEQLEKNNQKNASQSQKNASESMKKMAQKMQEMKQSQEEEALEENIEDLTKILDNLIKLSFNQEEIINKLSRLSNRDPLFIEYSQKQLQLQRDAEVLEDSLYALAKRLIEIETVVTKEVNTLKELLGESSELIKQRNASRALVKQQYAMTSMNNLALMLDQILDNLQAQMSQQAQGDQMCQKPGNKKSGKNGKPSPSMGEMQKQLNDMIQQLKDGQKQGKSMSSELAKAAAQQEMLRRGLQELQKSGTNGKENQQMGEDLKKLEQIMEQTEKDLLNNQISEKTVQRQQDILTRLLEAENATRERDLDEKRKATEAKTQFKPNIPNYEKYLQTKQKQIELLQTIPPTLSPYYKKEVNEYFENIDK